MSSVLLAIAVLVAAVLAYAALQAPSFRIQRSAHIAAPMLQVAELIDDFRAWQRWSPWEQLDPTLQRTFSGAETGVGAVYEWTSRGKAGAGRMEITGMSAGAEQAVITIQLDFLKPFKASNTAEFVLRPTDTGTDVAWAMFGPRPFVSKLMGVFINIDKLVGKDFEAGLAAIQREAAKAAA
jgi:hypothetical protein